MNLQQNLIDKEEKEAFELAVLREQVVYLACWLVCTEENGTKEHFLKQSRQQAIKNVENRNAK